jgi:hypothetical protein
VTDVRRVDYIGRVVMEGSTLTWSRTDGVAAYETPTGLRLDGVINTCDCVYQYEDEAGNTWGELRLAADVQDPAVLKAWGLSPLTDDHPDVWVTPENWDEFAVGTLGSNVRVDGTATLADIAVNAAETIAKVKAGKVGLSCGYGCTLVPEEGELNGVPYKFRQTAYVPNHVSIVDEPRGEGCEFVIDGVRSVRSRPMTPNKDSESEPMKTPTPKNEDKAGSKPKPDAKIMIGEAEMEVPDEVAAMIAELKAKVEEQGAKLAELSAAGDAEPPPPPVEQPQPAMDSAKKPAPTSDAAEVERAMLRERNAQLEAKLASLTGDGLDIRVSARSALMSQARSVLGEKAALDGKSNREIKVAVVSAIAPETAKTLDGKSEDAVDTAYTMAIGMHSRANDSSADLLALARGHFVPQSKPVDLNTLFSDNLNSLRIQPAGGN